MDKDTLKQLMEAKGITIKELSEAIGAAPITINMWLMGEHKPGEKYLPRVEAFFDIDNGKLEKTKVGKLVAHANNRLYELSRHIDAEGFEALTDLSQILKQIKETL